MDNFHMTQGYKWHAKLLDVLLLKGKLQITQRKRIRWNRVCLRGNQKDKGRSCSHLQCQLCLLDCMTYSILGLHLIGRFVWHFINIAISVFLDSVSIHTNDANDSSCIRFLSYTYIYISIKHLVFFLT